MSTLSFDEQAQLMMFDRMMSMIQQTNPSSQDGLTANHANPPTNHSTSRPTDSHRYYQPSQQQQYTVPQTPSVNGDNSGASSYHSQNHLKSHFVQQHTPVASNPPTPAPPPPPPLHATFQGYQSSAHPQSYPQSQQQQQQPQLYRQQPSYPHYSQQQQQQQSQPLSQPQPVFHPQTYQYQPHHQAYQPSSINVQQQQSQQPFRDSASFQYQQHHNQQYHHSHYHYPAHSNHVMSSTQVQQQPQAQMHQYYNQQQQQQQQHHHHHNSDRNYSQQEQQQQQQHSKQPAWLHEQPRQPQNLMSNNTHHNREEQSGRRSESNYEHGKHHRSFGQSSRQLTETTGERETKRFKDPSEIAVNKILLNASGQSNDDMQKEFLKSRQDSAATTTTTTSSSNKSSNTGLCSFSITTDGKGKTDAQRRLETSQMYFYNVVGREKRSCAQAGDLRTKITKLEQEKQERSIKASDEDDNDAVDESTQVEENQGFKKEEIVGEGMNRYFFDKKGQICYRCGKSGHVRNACLQEESKWITCYYCLGDHLAHRCEQKVCFRCGEIGHEKMTCPMFVSNSNSSRGQGGLQYGQSSSSASRQFSGKCQNCLKNGHTRHECGVILQSMLEQRQRRDYGHGWQDDDRDKGSMVCLNCREHGHVNCARDFVKVDQLYAETKLPDQVMQSIVNAMVMVEGKKQSEGGMDNQNSDDEVVVVGVGQEEVPKKGRGMINSMEIE